MGDLDVQHDIQQVSHVPRPERSPSRRRPQRRLEAQEVMRRALSEWVQGETGAPQTGAGPNRETGRLPPVSMVLHASTGQLG